MDNSYESPKRRSKNALFTYLGIIVSVLVITFLVLLNNSEAIRKLVQPNSATDNPDNQRVVKPSLVPLAHPPRVGQKLTIPDCNIKAEGNPLIQSVSPDKEINLITLYGNINTISLDNKNPVSATIEVISPKAEQTYNFVAKQEKGLVFDYVTGKEISLNEITPGMIVSVSLNCVVSNPSQIRIAQIAKLSK